MPWFGLVAGRSKWGKPLNNVYYFMHSILPLCSPEAASLLRQFLTITMEYSTLLTNIVRLTAGIQCMSVHKSERLFGPLFYITFVSIYVQQGYEALSLIDLLYGYFVKFWNKFIMLLIAYVVVVAAVRKAVFYSINIQYLAEGRNGSLKNASI